MKETILLINNRKYRIFCEENQEQHVQQLGQKLLKYLEKLHISNTQTISSEVFLMICLTLMNELEELKRENVYTRANSISNLKDDNFMENLHILVDEINDLVDNIDNKIKK